MSRPRNNARSTPPDPWGVGIPYERWGTKAEGMPDDCHDDCVPQGRLAIYFPYRWDKGVARYLCEFGHRWTCGWGHSVSGIAPENAGRAHLKMTAN